MISIYSHTENQYCQELFSRLGKGKRHAAHLYRSWFREGKFFDPSDWPEKQAAPLLEKMIGLTDCSLPRLSKKTGEGETVKFLLRFEDGMESESVAIPMESGVTLCISSQVGCKMGCTFCETGRMGLLRHLSAGEIVAQVFFARFHLHIPVRNIVFMGMGEPFDNYGEVMQAVRVLTDPAGCGFGPSRLTISTSGRVDEMYRFIEEADPAVNLAVSVNAPNDAIRDRLMPVNKQWNMGVLKEAMAAYCAHPRREILAEYVLIKGVNDTVECADELASYLTGLKVKVNLIPYNPQSRDRYAPPDPEAREAFLARMRSRGYHALLRGAKGQGIMAACGQLGNKQQRREAIANGRLPIL